MIQNYRSIPDLDTIHQDQHRLLFANCLGVIEKVATVAPTADTLPVGYMQFSLIGGVRNIYFNSGGTIVKVSVESDVNAKAAKGANTDITSLAGLTTPLSRAQGGLASTVANNAANGVVFLDASSKLPAVDGSLLTGILTSYDSGWFAVSANTEYTKTHNLGTTKLLVKLYFSDSSTGASNVFESCAFYSGSTGYGSMIREVTTTTLIVSTGYTTVAYRFNTGSITSYASGYCRVIALKL